MRIFLSVNTITNSFSQFMFVVFSYYIFCSIIFCIFFLCVFVEKFYSGIRIYSLLQIMIINVQKPLTQMISSAHIRRLYQQWFISNISSTRFWTFILVKICVNTEYTREYHVRSPLYMNGFSFLPKQQIECLFAYAYVFGTFFRECPSTMTINQHSKYTAVLWMNRKANE